MSVEAYIVKYWCDRCGWFSDDGVGMVNMCPECAERDKLRFVEGTQEEVKEFEEEVRNAYESGAL